jgi:hypothetical protein
MTAATSPCEQETGFSLKELIMLPVILLWLTLQAFAQHAVKLKELRRTRPMPRNWQEHWSNLRLAEWHVQELTASGIAQLLSGGELDLGQLSMIPDPPGAFGQMPASAWEMHRRFEAIARFHAEPERYIRRAARRVIAREGKIDPLGRIEPRPATTAAAAITAAGGGDGGGGGLFLPAASFSAQHIRAPPWLAGSSGNQTRSSPPTASARTRDHVRRKNLPATHSLFPTPDALSNSFILFLRTAKQPIKLDRA